MKLIEKIKSNNVVSKILEIWKNRRYRGLIILGLWFIFFFFVIMLLRVSARNNQNTPQQTIKTVPNILENIKNYEFQYDITQDDITYSINGSYIDDETLFTYNENTYFIKDKIYIVNNEELQEVENPIEIDISKLNIENIYNLIKDKDKLYETEESGIKTTVYKISINEFSKLFGIDIESEDFIEINIETKDNSYESIYMDLTQYMNYYELKYRKYNIKLELNSINDVDKSSYGSLVEGE